jgi:hypothetical protein
MSTHDAESFIKRWRTSGGAENANAPLFLAELCDLLGVERPHPACPEINQNAYTFERDVFFPNPDGTESRGRIDLYKRGSFVLEAKQGTQAPGRSAPDRWPTTVEVRSKPDHLFGLIFFVHIAFSSSLTNRTV